MEDNSGRYDNWCAVAGFFDGDGGIDVEARSYTLHWVLNFVDNWPPQVIQIKRFLESENVRVGAVRDTGTGGFKIEVAEIESLKKCARMMLAASCLFKKREELQMMIAYFEGKVSGDDVSTFLNGEVSSGIRVGKLRTTNIPYTYFEGKKVYKKGYCRNSPSPLQALSEDEREMVRKSYAEAGETIYQLAAVYRVSPSTIFRAVRGLHRGCKPRPAG